MRGNKRNRLGFMHVLLPQQWRRGGGAGEWRMPGIKLLLRQQEQRKCQGELPSTHVRGWRVPIRPRSYFELHFLPGRPVPVFFPSHFRIMLYLRDRSVPVLDRTKLVPVVRGRPVPDLEQTKLVPVVRGWPNLGLWLNLV